MTRSPFFALLALAAFALPAAAQVAPAAAATSTATATATATPSAGSASATAVKAPKFPLHGSASLGHYLGSGTFNVAPANPTFSSLLGLTGSASVGDWGFAVSQRLGLEYTQSDGNTYNNQLELSDTRFAASYNGLKLEEPKLALSLSASYALPISLASRFVGSLGPIGLSARGSWQTPVAGLGANATLTTGYTPALASLAARYANAPGRGFNDRTQGFTDTQACIVRNESELGSFPCSGPPNAFRWGAGAGVTYTFLNDELTASADLSYVQSFSSFAVLERDELTSDNAVVGFVPRQSTLGSLGLTWSPVQWFALTGGLYSAQPFLSADGKGLRFPFWDFVSPYNNFSSLFVDTTFQI